MYNSHNAVQDMLDISYSLMQAQTIITYNWITIIGTDTYDCHLEQHRWVTSSRRQTLQWKAQCIQ